MYKKGLLAGLANLIIGMGLNFGLQAIFPDLGKEYQNTALFRPWSDPLMMIYFAYPFVLGVVAAYLWNLVSKNFTGSPAKKAWQFAKLYFIIATIPGMFVSYTCFQVSLLMILSWSVAGFINIFVAGLIFTKVK